MFYYQIHGKKFFNSLTIIYLIKYIFNTKHYLNKKVFNTKKKITQNQVPTVIQILYIL